MSTSQRIINLTVVYIFFEYIVDQKPEPEYLPYKAKSSFWLGYLSRQKEHYGSAVLHYSLALDLYGQINDEIMVARSAWDVGECLTMVGNPTLANKYYDKAESVFLEHGFPVNAYLFFHDRGWTLWKQGKVNDAEYYFRKSIESNKIDLLSKSKVFNLLGACYRKLGNYEAARNHYSKAIELGKEVESIAAIGWAMMNWGKLYEYQNQPDSAEIMYLKVIELVHEFPYPKLLGTTKINLAKLYHQQGKEEIALRLAIDGIELVKSLEDKSDLLDGLKLGIELSHQVEIDTLFREYLDQLFKSVIPANELAQTKEQLSQNSEVEKGLLELEIEKLRASIKEQPIITLSFLVGLFIVLAVLMVVIVIRFNRRLSEARLVAHKMRAEIKQLRKHDAERTEAEHLRMAQTQAQRKQWVEDWVNKNTGK